MSERTTLLIVDDSRIFRGAVAECLAGEPDIAVIGSAYNGVKALESIREQRPDLVTLDLEMPELDGLETLKAIQQLNEGDRGLPPIGVIMVSAFTRKGADVTIAALENGAFDFITKPVGVNTGENSETLRRQLLTKIRFFASRQGKRGPRTGMAPILAPPPLPRRAPEGVLPSQIKAVLIGISTGGPKALVQILPQLCAQLDLPVFIVQHMPPTFTASLAASLNGKCSYTVKEAVDQEEVAPRHVYIAPGGRHLLLRRREGKVITVVNDQPPEGGCRPAVNVLFHAGAAVYGPDLLAIVMTGMGVDGTKGIGALKRGGAYIMAQDEETSVVWGMPGSAVASGNVDEIVPLEEIPDRVVDAISRPRR